MASYSSPIRGHLRDITRSLVEGFFGFGTKSCNIVRDAVQRELLFYAYHYKVSKMPLYHWLALRKPISMFPRMSMMNTLTYSRMKTATFKNL